MAIAGKQYPKITDTKPVIWQSGQHLYITGRQSYDSRLDAFAHGFILLCKKLDSLF